MKKFSKRKLSLLGLVLLAASAVTAAVIPSNTKHDSKVVDNGVLTDSTGASGIENTCRTRITGDVAANCTHTETGNGALLSSTSGTSVNSNGVSSSPSGTNTTE